MSDLLKAELNEKTGNTLTPRGRMWFCMVAEKFLSKSDKAKGKTLDKDGAYIVTIVIPPNADLSVLKQQIKAKAEEKWGSKLPGNLKSPIKKCGEMFDKNGDPKYPAEMAEWLQITANTYQQRPNVVDAKGNPLSKLLPGESTDDVTERLKAECYSGRWGRLSVQPATYDTDGNRGVKLYLQNIQVLDHDEVLGGRGAKAEDDFAPVGGGSEPAAAGKAADSVFD